MKPPRSCQRSTGPNVLEPELRDELVAAYGTPLYVYDLDVLEEAVTSLVAELPQPSRLLYSLKANPHPELVESIAAQGLGMEVSSLGELDVARGHGGTGPVLATGPAKSTAFLDALLSDDRAVLSVESQEELVHLSGASAQLLIRLRSFHSAGRVKMAGFPTQFGMSTEQLEKALTRIAASPNLDCVGAHCFGGSDVPTSEGLRQGFADAAASAADFAALNGGASTAALGGGFAAPHGVPGAPPPYMIAGEVAKMLDETLPGWKAGVPSILFESGRRVVGPCGTLLTSVMAVKDVDGNRFVLLDAGINVLNGVLAGRSLAGGRVQPSSRPWDHGIGDAVLAGPLCTPADRLATRAALPAVRRGDVLEIANVGAYGRSASLVEFLSHPQPTEVVLAAGAVISATRVEHRRQKAPVRARTHAR